MKLGQHEIPEREPSAFNVEEEGRQDAIHKPFNLSLLAGEQKS